ncbi:MAG: hypothetical protein GY765_39775, partial [bacterium]|nr:hypothetical protein [bacterium]
MRITVCILLLVLLTGTGVMGKIVPMPDLLNPNSIQVQGDHLVVSQFAPITIYSLKDFKAVKTFGKEGEGPGEFKLIMGRLGMFIDLYPDNILVYSMGKVSLFTWKGELIKEKKVTAARMSALGDKYVGMAMQLSDDPGYAFNLYNTDGQKEKELCAHKAPVIKSGRAMLLDFIAGIQPTYRVHGDKVFVAGTQALDIR